MATEAHNDEIVVAVVGVTGSGKSSFIKRVTGNESIEIGHDLRSKTAEVQAYPLQIMGKCYTLVDTPGFDDGERTDEDIFASLADWLRRSYNKGQRLNALLYLHGIIANREKGSDLRNLKVFKKLCGAENYGRIVLGITWWDQVDPQTALARETMLAETPEFWGDMVQKGSRIERIPHDKAQCMQLLYSLVQNQRTTLRVQHEMAEGKEALRTTAAMEMEQYKAIDAIKDAEEGERRAQEIAYQLKNKAIEQWASERRLEQHRRHQELQMQQMSQIADLETIRARMSESEPSRRSPRPEASDRTRRIEELAAALQQARLRTQPPSYTADNRLERMSIMARINMHVDKISAADQQLNELVGNAKQGWDSILDPTTGDFPLWKAFCDRCLRQASVKGYWTKMRLDVKRQLLARSERVKGIDFHPTEPWILTTLYSGHVYIWSYETQAIVKTFELTDVPVRAGRFIARKNWIVCGSDDFQVRVYNYNTSEKITSFEAHPDYIRAIVVHPTQSFVLTASDDMTIKLWDWDKGWKCVQIYEGHSHYVMGLAINPKDTNTFASACLDRTVKIWSFGSGHANYTLEAHETKGVNHVDYYPQADKPYLLTTSDDQTVKIWDYTTKSMIATLEGHTSNVSFACYHPELPVIISGSEDGTVKIWHANTYRLEQSLTYGLERAWCVSYQRGKQGVAVGFDDGAVVVKMGREEPAVSMDSSGKLIWARHSEVLSSVIKGGDIAIKDGTPLSLPAKELGNCEIYPQTLQHSPNGRFVSVCGDGEYIIYTALAWRNKAFGSAQDFAWGSKDNSNDYAIRESSMSVRIFRNFKEKGGGIDVGFQAEGLSGGVLLGVRGQGGIGLFDWESGALVRRIEVEPKNVYWSESGELVTLACDETFYVLRYSRENYLSALQAGQVEDDGVESAFEVVTDITESVRTGQWVGDCFVYTNSTNRLNYLVGDQTYTVSHFDQPMYLLGYLPRDGRAYIADKDVNVTSFALSLRVVEYQTLVLRGELDTAAELLEDIPADQKNKIARFLEGQGYKEMALEVATDPEHRFDLALGLNNLAIALEIAKEAKAEHRWKTVGDAALAAWDIVLAEECFVNAKDLGSLLLVYTATANAAGLRDLAKQADEAAAFNITFSCLWQLGDIDGCIDILLKTGKTAEAVLFSQTYKPSRCRDVVGKWKEGLEKNSKTKLSRTLGVPPNEGEGDEELFPEWDEWLRLEQKGAQNGGSLIDVSDGPGEDGVDGEDGEDTTANAAEVGVASMME
ncbi:MAG: hypothetical protein LQ341_002110 [Variospora aurantia]|nr:MAG: hypothetical protein LQ341_002110 [Variospora aurantia]